MASCFRPLREAEIVLSHVSILEFLSKKILPCWTLRKLQERLQFFVEGNPMHDLFSHKLSQYMEGCSLQKEGNSLMCLKSSNFPSLLFDFRHMELYYYYKRWSSTLHRPSLSGLLIQVVPTLHVRVWSQSASESIIRWNILLPEVYHLWTKFYHKMAFFHFDWLQQSFVRFEF